MKLGYLEFCNKLMKDYNKWYDSQQLNNKPITLKKSERGHGIKKYYEKKAK